jgi:putative FmdB family regulatory protein
MPLYEYRCDACGHKFEQIQLFSDPILSVCEECGGALKKLISSPAFQLKGSGWYASDYPKLAAAKSSGSDSAGGDRDGSGSGEKSDSDKSASTSSSDAKSSDTKSSDSRAEKSSEKSGEKSSEKPAAPAPKSDSGS